MTFEWKNLEHLKIPVCVLCSVKIKDYYLEISLKQRWIILCDECAKQIHDAYKEW